MAYGDFEDLTRRTAPDKIFITNAFQKTLDKSGRKPNKIWVDKGSEFCNISMQS